MRAVCVKGMGIKMRRDKYQKTVRVFWGKIQAAVILPAVFSTFPVFLVYRSFLGIPETLIEAAKIDGAGEWRIFLYIGLPLARGGVLSAVTLGFLEYWNMMEEPMAFLTDKALWPLSLYLPEIGYLEACLKDVRETGLQEESRREKELARLEEDYDTLVRQKDLEISRKRLAYQAAREQREAAEKGLTGTVSGGDAAADIESLKLAEQQAAGVTE